MSIRERLRVLIVFAQRRERAALLVVFVLAFLLRAGFALTMRDEFYFPDSHRYADVARNVIEGRGFVLDDGWPFLPFPDEHPGPYYAVSAPGYPAFLAGCYLIAGESILFARLMHALMGAATCLVIFQIAAMLFGKKTALAASLMCAIYPFLVFFSGLVLTETLFVLLLCTFVMLALGLSEKPSFAAAGIAGAVGAWATQVRSSFLFLPFLLLPVLAWRAKERKRFLLAGVGVLMSMGFFLAPWTIRNQKLLGHPVVTTTRGGMGIFEANAEGATGASAMARAPWPRKISTMGEWERDAFLKAEARRIILADPARFVRLAFKKAARMWNVVINFEGYSKPFYNAVSLFSYVPVMLLAIAGGLIRRRDARNWLVLLLPALYFTAVHMVFIGSIRYRLPAMPFLMVLSAFALARAIPEDDLGSYELKESTTCRSDPRHQTAPSP